MNEEEFEKFVVGQLELMETKLGFPKSLLNILIAACGESTLPGHLAEYGYSRITSTDDNFGSIHSVFTCIVDLKPKFYDDFCSSVSHLLGNGSKLILWVKTTSKLPILLKQFSEGHAITMSLAGDESNLVMIVDKLPRTCVDCPCLIDYSPLESDAFTDLGFLRLMQLINERRKEKYSNGEVFITPHMVEAGLLTLLDFNLAVIKNKRYFRFRYKTLKNEYTTCFYEREVASATPCCFIWVMKNTVSESSATLILDSPENYAYLMSDDCSRLVLVRQSVPRKYISRISEVQADLDAIYKKLSPTGGRNFEIKCKWLSQKIINDGAKNLTYQMRASHQYDESLMEEKQVIPSTSGGSSHPSLVRTSPETETSPKSDIPFPPPSSADCVEHSDTPSSLAKTLKSTMESADSVEHSDAPSLLAETSMKSTMHLESRIPYSSDVTKFGGFPESDAIKSSDYFHLDDLGFCIAKENLEKKRVIKELRFEDTLTSWLSNNVDRWSPVHAYWNTQDLKMRNLMTDVPGWDAARPTDTCRSLIHGIICSVVDYYESRGSPHGDLRSLDNYLLKFKEECLYGASTTTVNVELVHRVMENDRQKDMVTDFSDLLDLGVSSLSNLPRIWRDLLLKISKFSDETYVKIISRSLAELKMQLLIIKDHPALWTWRRRSSFYGFMWRTWNEEKLTSTSSDAPSLLYTSLLDVFSNLKLKSWHDRIPKGSPYFHLYNAKSYADSSVELLRYLRVLHLHIFQFDLNIGPHYHMYFSSGSCNDLFTEENSNAEYIEIVTSELFFPFLPLLHEKTIKATYENKIL